MRTLAARAEAKHQIAQQTILIEELEKAGHTTLASVARDMLTAMRKTEELRQPCFYRRIRSREGRTHVLEPQMLMG
jgi:hypothetical protein